MRSSLLALAILATGCGYVKAGKWEDDPGNWERAFGSPLPPGCIILHSVYWRNAHFTFEGGHYFRVKVTEAVKHDLTASPGWILAPPDAASATSGPCVEPPPWFAPTRDKRFQMWMWKDGAAHQRFFIDPKGDEAYLSACEW